MWRTVPVLWVALCPPNAKSFVDGDRDAAMELSPLSEDLVRDLGEAEARAIWKM